MTLDLKYRPKTFEEVIGNEAQIDSLVIDLEKEDGPHSFVITGPSGCGKTTLARIAAEHIGADVLSVKENNTADNRGIEAVRAMIEQCHYSMGGAKVFIIDEAHGLTPDAKRALLKPTEEPAEHVYWFFLTTDPTKLFKGDEGKALKTRLTQIKVESIKEVDLYKHLRKIGKKERLEVEIDVLKSIAGRAAGSPRQAIKFLDAIKDLEGEDLQMERLDTLALGDSDEEVIDFCRKLFSKNPQWKTLANFIKGFKAKKDPEEVRRIVMGYAQSMLLNTGSPKVGYALECFCDYEYSSGWPGITLATFQAINGE